MTVEVVFGSSYIGTDWAFEFFLEVTKHFDEIVGTTIREFLTETGTDHVESVESLAVILADS